MPDQRPVAVAGRVPVKATMENEAIRRGDALSPASKPGYAMKAPWEAAYGQMLVSTGAASGLRLYQSGSTSFDSHSVSESTAGGNCVPGDTGYILEQNVRTTKTWELAKEICTQNNMRLPEVFELKLACKNQTTWSLTSIGDGNEWSSNQTFSHWQPNSSYDTAVPVMQASCAQITLGNVGHSSNSEDSNPYRCAR